MKLSEGRLPSDGIESVVRIRKPIWCVRHTLMNEQLPGLPVGSGSIGLISRDPQSIQHFIQLLLESAPWLSNCDALEIPWRQEKLDAVRQRATLMNGSLVFALMKDDGHLIPDLPTKQALATLEQSLKLCGHEVS